MKINALFLSAFVILSHASFAQSDESMKGTTKAAMNAPAVKAGSVIDAENASENGRLAIHIYGAKGSKMSAEQYAKTLANAFADRKYTDKPMYITVTHEENDKFPRTAAVIFMNGNDYFKNGTGTFTPEQIGGAIQIITSDFVAKHGSALIIPENVQPNFIN